MEDHNILLSASQQEKIIEQACRIANLDCHIKHLYAQRDADTRAEQIAYQFKGPGRSMPVKNSYVYCDALDVCFFFMNGNKPAFSYTGYATVHSKDATGGLVNAFAKANGVLRYMAELMDREAEQALKEDSEK